MRTELRLSPHKVNPGEQVIEIWHGGRFIGTVTPGDGRSILVISKHRLSAASDAVNFPLVNGLTVRIGD